jgi:chromosomal replication initiator protein
MEASIMTIERIQSSLAERMNIPLGVLISQKRDNRTAFARQLGYYLCRKHAHASFLCIGESFNRDHSSIIHGVRAIAGRMEAEPAFRLTVRRIEHDLGLFSQAEFYEYRELSSGC